MATPHSNAVTCSNTKHGFQMDPQGETEAAGQSVTCVKMAFERHGADSSSGATAHTQDPGQITTSREKQQFCSAI